MELSGWDILKEKVLFQKRTAAEMLKLIVFRYLNLSPKRAKDPGN